MAALSTRTYVGRVGQVGLPSASGGGIMSGIGQIGSLALQGYQTYMSGEIAEEQAGAQVGVARYQAQEQRAATERVWQVVAVVGGITFVTVTGLVALSLLRGRRRNPTHRRSRRSRRNPFDPGDRVQMIGEPYLGLRGEVLDEYGPSPFGKSYLVEFDDGRTMAVRERDLGREKNPRSRRSRRR